MSWGFSSSHPSYVLVVMLVVILVVILVVMLVVVLVVMLVVVLVFVLVVMLVVMLLEGEMGNGDQAQNMTQHKKLPGCNLFYEQHV